MKDSDKANSAAFGFTKMQFFISNSPPKSQWPHTSHSLSMRLMQQTLHDQANSELFFPVKVPLLMRMMPGRAESRGRTEVLRPQELSCAKPDVSQRNQAGTPTSSCFSISKMPRTYSRSKVHSTASQQTSHVPKFSVTYKHPELTLHSSTFPCITQRTKQEWEALEMLLNNVLSAKSISLYSFEKCF